MRADRYDVSFAMAAAVAAVAILRLGAGLTFFSDEWALIEARSLGDPGTWFPPHNEHWYTFPILVYRLLVETVGLGSYMPYLALLVALHISVATLTYRLVRRTSGPWPALAVGLIVLVLGSGFENLYWAFQIGFVGSLSMGLAAILVFDQRGLSHRRAVAGTAFLATSVATSGIGLICCIAVGVELLLDPQRRRSAIWLLIPAVLYGAWYLTFGRTGVDAHRGAFGLARPWEVPPLVWNGFAAATGAVTGLGTNLGGVVLLTGILILVAWVLLGARPRIAPRAAGALSAVATMYGLIALARAFAGPDAADVSRYTYISAVLVMIGISAQVGIPAPETPVQRRTFLLLGGLVFTLSLLWNARLLIAGRPIFEDRAERTRALIAVALERPLPATTDPDRTLVLVPSPAALSRIVAEHGSPLEDWLVPGAVRPIRPEVIADARRTLAEGAEIPLPPSR